MPATPDFILSCPDVKSNILSAFEKVVLESPIVKIKLSLPTPPVRVSAPCFPLRLSSPTPPFKLSFWSLPIKLSFPDSPFIVADIVVGAVRVSLVVFCPFIVNVSCPDVNVVAVMLAISIVLPAFALII